MAASTPVHMSPELLAQSSDAEALQAVNSRARGPLRQLANTGMPTLFFVVAMVAAILTCISWHSPGLHSNAKAINSAIGLDLIGAFDKCGGEDVGEELPCTKGCACIPKSQFFHQCMPPGSGGKCNVAEAKKEYHTKQAQMGHIVTHGQAVTKAKKQAVKARNNAAKELKDAKNHEAVLEKQTKELESEKKMTAGLAEEQAKNAQQAKAKHMAAAKRAKEAVTEAGRKKPGHEEWMNALDPDKTSADGAEPWNACAGEQHKTKPCQPGCACKFKDKYFSECEPPKKSVKCDIDGAKKMAAKAGGVYKKAVAKRDRLTSLAKAANEKFQKAHQQSQAAKLKAAKTASDLEEATNKLKEARKARAEAEKRAASTAEAAKKAIAAHKKLSPEVKKATTVLNKWKQAAGF